MKVKRFALAFCLCAALTACAKGGEDLPLSASLMGVAGVEIGSRVTVEQLVETPGGYTLQNGADAVDTSKIGVCTFEVKLVDEKGKERTGNISVNVIDTTPPEIEAEDFYLLKSREELSALTAKDNSGENIAVNYTLKQNSPARARQAVLTARDSSGNRAEKTVTFVLESDIDSSFTTGKGFTGYTIEGVSYIRGYLIVNKTYSLPASYGDGITDEAQAAFDLMQTAAKEDGIDLQICSGYRSYDYQSQLFNNYAAKDGLAAAETYSARPGHSEHQSGLGMDLNMVDDAFENTPAYAWLQENCRKYGFVLRYVKGKTDETGYVYESWHYRYVGKDLAEKLYNNGDWITLEDYFGVTSQYAN